MDKQSQLEDAYLEEKKKQCQECIFVMRPRQRYLGIIEDYDDKVIKLKCRVPLSPGEIMFPQDVLLYRKNLSSIYREKL